MDETQNSRRSFLKVGSGLIGSAVLVGAASKSLAAAASAVCGVGATPPQTPGPFYPGEAEFSVGNDLTVVAGMASKALGQVVYITGKVLDMNCVPINGANVEIWQACAAGSYNNPKDDNPAPRDPNFKYWGEVYTDADGYYSFKTIIPGAYPADTNWVRPPHVHFKISKIGYHELTTQMYFKGNQYNDTDLILKAIPAHERGSVIVDFLPSSSDREAGSLSGEFDITLKRVIP